MTATPFSLIPFPGLVAPTDLHLTGTIERQDNVLQLTYQLSGSLEAVVFPPSKTVPLRRDQLWQHTCLEFFLGVSGSDPYWEINLSPTGDWNVYRFSAYRQGMEPEAAFLNLPFNAAWVEGSFLLDVRLTLDTLVSPKQALAVGVTAVIESQGKELSYWALNHPGDQPDFHRREGFIVKLQ